MPRTTKEQKRFLGALPLRGFTNLEEMRKFCPGYHIRTVGQLSSRGLLWWSSDMTRFKISPDGRSALREADPHD